MLDEDYIRRQFLFSGMVIGAIITCFVIALLCILLLPVVS